MSVRGHPGSQEGPPTTFEIYLHSDYSVSVVTANVDPAVAEGTPAATSRAHAIATQQIAQTNLLPNSPNVQKAYGAIPVDSMDPTRPQMVGVLQAMFPSSGLSGR